MDYSTNKPSFVFLHNGVNLTFDKMQFSCSARISKYPVIGGHIDTTLEGVEPKTIILSGRFLIRDFTRINAYITNNTGSILIGLKINGRTYNDMRLVDGQATVDSSQLYGNMIFKLMEGT